MPHIHTDPGHHDHTVSAYIIKHDWGYDMGIENPKLLVHMHKKFRILLQPGGHIELNENPWAAISHEIKEETGYGMDQLTLLQPGSIAVTKLSSPTVILHPTPLYTNTHKAGENNHFHTDTAYLFHTTEEPRYEIGEDESQDLRWLSLEEILESPVDLVSEIVKEVAPVAFHIFSNDEWRGHSPLAYKTRL